MCGFTGVITSNKVMSADLKESNKFSICRGPDNQKNLKGKELIFEYEFWFNRLAILDLSDKANQPMKSNSQNSIIMFNGEIYNSEYLRKNLICDKYLFSTSHSDTETLLAGLEIYGIDFLKYIEGQFSIFYWNKRLKKIYLIRDRLGQKPLYYYFANKEIHFASNKKSILKLNNKLNINKRAIDQFVSYGAIFSPNTIFENIYKVNPGQYIEIDYSTDIFQKKEFNYWELENYVNNKKFVKEEFLQLFKDAVNKRLYSDVPIASFLSGGIDSTSIVKCLYDSGVDVNTFSVVVDDKKINEKIFIDEVSKKYKTNHKEVFVNSDISNTLVRESLLCLDEPYGDPSVVPSYVLSQQISNDFKVAMSGDGGDELLGGYSRMKNHLKSRNSVLKLLSNMYDVYPALFGTGTFLRSFSSDLESSYLSYLEDEKFLKFISKNVQDTYFSIYLNNSQDIYKSILQYEYMYYLSDQMMFKVDRTSMANSLEVRSPLVDHKLVEYVLSHSTDYIKSDIQKLPLYQYLSTDFNTEFLNRPKQGFVFDYKKWVFSNFDFIIEIIEDSQVKEYIKIEKLKYLKNFKSRINALRIWRIYVLSIYLNSTKSL